MSSKLQIVGEKTSHHEQIIKRFSMYIYIRDEPGKTRTTLVQKYHPFLKELMTYLVEHEPTASEEYWSRFFLKNLINFTHTYPTILFNRFPLYGFYLLVIFNQLCQQLLISYLQLICFYAAKQISNQLKQSPNFKLHYPLEECFVIACEASLRPGKLLKNFDFCSDFPLYGYARKTLNRTITNQVVKDFKLRSIKLSDYGLLNSLTPTKLEKYLRLYGISSGEIRQHCLACQIFQELFLEFFPPDAKGKINRKYITYLSQQQLEQISLVYNQRSSKLNTKIAPIVPEKIQEILTVCIKSARMALQKQFISIEEPNIAVNLGNYEPDQLLQTEKQTHLAELENTILDSFHSLNQNVKTSLLLWLGLEINQIDLIALLDLQKQYQVTRYFQRQQKKILKKTICVLLSKYSAESISIEELNRLCLDNLEYIKEYLQKYCKDSLGNILALIIKDNFSWDEKEVLISHSADDNLLSKQYDRIYEKLKNLLQVGIENELKISLSQFSSTEKYLSKFVRKWIQKNTAFLYQMR